MASATTRQRYLEAVVERVLEEGRVDQSVAALAEAAGTSDRMLLYYFGTRDALMTEAIDQLATRRRTFGVALLAKVSQAPSAVEGIVEALRWMCAPDQAASARLLRHTAMGALEGDALLAEMEVRVRREWLQEATLTGRRLGADEQRATRFGTLLLALIDALPTDQALTRERLRVEASIDAAADLLAAYVTR